MFLILRKAAPPPTEEELKKCLRRFEWLVNFTIVKRRFVHQILGMMDKQPSSLAETICVAVLPSGRFLLQYSPTWVSELSDAEAAFVFYHEILHLALHHCTCRQLGPNRGLARLAADLAVNDLIPVEAGCQPPRDKEGNLVGAFVSELKKREGFEDIESKQSAEWYYEYLSKKKKEGKPGGLDGEDQESNIKIAIDDHSGWNEDEIADEKVRAKILEIDRMDKWGFGNESLCLRETILAAQVKKVNWRNYVRQFIGNILWKTKHSTRKRPNRRTGYIHPGSKRYHVDKVLVGLDASGSTWTTKDMLSEFLGIINDMTDFFPIDVMQFDSEKTEGPKPFDRKRLNYEFVGSGGTDFQPVMDMARKGGYKAVVMLTDGEANPPACPPATEVLWVLPKGHHPPVDWGRQIHLEKFV